jgi:hypothetical protein
MQHSCSERVNSCLYNRISVALVSRVILVMCNLIMVSHLEECWIVS